MTQRTNSVAPAAPPPSDAEMDAEQGSSQAQGGAEEVRGALPSWLVAVARRARRLFASRRLIDSDPVFSEWKALAWQRRLVLKWPRFSRSHPLQWAIFKHPLLLGFYLAGCTAALALFAIYSGYKATVAGFGSVSSQSCAASFMSETGCGDLNAVNCEPFTQSLAIRCPAGCISQLAWNPIYLGASGVQYTQFVVGSNNAYRGDSWICSAAIHAGVLSNSKGGCIVANLNPSKNETYAASSENGITSLNFNSTYPASLSFQQLGPSDSAYCTDLGFYSEGFFLPWFMILPFLNVTRKQLFWCSTIGMYLFWVFVSPDTARDDGHISGYLGSLLPGIAVLYILYTFIISHTMPKPSQFPLETSFLFVGLTWFGFHLDMLTNYIKGLPTLSFSSDMFKNTAQLPALIVLLIIVLGLIFHFSYLHYKRDTLFPLFVAYAVYFIIYFSLPHIVGLSIHVHHYIFALLCFPLTRVRNRVALICQSLLLGLFLQGILKFGFASPFDTHLQARAIYTLGTTQTLWDIQLLDLRNASAPAPAIPLTWVYPYNSTLNVTDLDTRSLQAALRLHTAADVWDRMPVNEYSLTLNDVQVYRGKQARFEVPAAGMVSPFDTVRGWDGPVYVRVAPVSFGSVLDYGDVAVIDFKKGTVSYSGAFQN